MGIAKKESNRRARRGQKDDSLENVRVKGENFYRDARKAKVLSMYNEGRMQRNSQGNITKAASYQSRDVPSAHIEPNRRWFTNTRSVSQETLQVFREAWAANAYNPYKILLKSNRLPLGLIRPGKDHSPGSKQQQAKTKVESFPFAEVFGPKARRKRVNLGVDSLNDLADSTLDSPCAYNIFSRASSHPGDDKLISTSVEPVFDKGQSKRIWNELYKVIDSSDVVLHVLDARDPSGTRCRSIERYLKQDAPHKHLIFILNKCDLVPTGTAAGWVRCLSNEYPTLAFHASMTNSFGKGSLITLLRQRKSAPWPPFPAKPKYGST
ncbi:hypothetical protein XA68_11081 [Ophiocordyceps unilateralis]|uniref:Nucleolar GTP-binding protein 2 n=1 Tax=Ophiocordyceps unilateralis TaxID=268505 RepID=A0A2A9P2C2_OPHUN|nr:hypothetical protein XA68_11081 [Ophiocordyceps unilateralis]